MPSINTSNLYLKHKKNNLFCIHEPDFTNAIYADRVKIFELSLSQTISKSWEEIANSPHFSPIESDNDKKRIKKYLKLFRGQFNSLKSEPMVYQIPIGEEEKFRAFVVYRKHFLNLLFFDPNHHFYPNFNLEKFKFPYEDNIACLKRKECCGKAHKKPLLIKEWKKKITEKGKKH